MTERKLILGALSWSLGILLAAYVYRVLITDPQFVRASQTHGPSPTTHSVTVPVDLLS